MKFTLFLLLPTLLFSFVSESGLLKKDQTMALKLANLLLRPEVSKCIEEAGFKGTKLLTQAASIKLSEKTDASVFNIRIDRYEILPTDGTRLAASTNLILESKIVRTRAGNDQAVTCKFIDAKEL